MKYVLVKGKAGLGNRMLCAVTAVLYARATGRRLVIDWRDPQYSDGMANGFHRFFICTEALPVGALSAEGSVFPPVWRGHLDLCAADLISLRDPRDLASFRAVRKYAADLRRTDYPEDILVVWSYLDQVSLVRRHLHGEWAEWRRWTREAILRRLLRDCLRLQPEIQARINTFAVQHWPGRTLIGVHVRYTDMKIPLSRYWGPVDRLMVRHPDAVIFLATDSREVLQRFRERYERVISTGKDLPADGRALHSGHGPHDKIAHGMDALVDMHLLARCQYLVYSSRSTFSYISHLLSESPEANIVDLDRYSVVLRAKRLVQAFV